MCIKSFKICIYYWGVCACPGVPPTEIRESDLGQLVSFKMLSVHGWTVTVWCSQTPEMHGIQARVLCQGILTYALSLRP